MNPKFGPQRVLARTYFGLDDLVCFASDWLVF